MKNKNTDPRKTIPLLTQISLLLIVLNPFFYYAIKNNQIWPFIVLVIGMIIFSLAHKIKDNNLYLEQWTKSAFFSFAIFLILGSYFLISLVGDSDQEKILFKSISGSWIIIVSLIFLLWGIKAKKYEKETLIS
jgi:hypothetical protein